MQKKSQNNQDSEEFNSEFFDENSNDFEAALTQKLTERGLLKPIQPVALKSIWGLGFDVYLDKARRFWKGA